MRGKISILFLVLLLLAGYSTYQSYVGNALESKQCVEEAKSYEEKELYLDAINSYEKAISLSSKSEQLLINIADDYYKMGDLSGYSKALKKVLAAYPESIAAISRMCNYYNVDRKNHSDMVRFISQKHREFPENEEIEEWFRGIKGEYTVLYQSYEEIGPYRSGYAVYSSEGKKGLLKENGEIFIHAVYDDIAFPQKREKQIAVLDGANIYYINYNGYKVGYTEEGTNPFDLSVKTKKCNQLCAVFDGNKWALTKKGTKKTVTEYVYDKVLIDQWGYVDFNENPWVCEAGKWYPVNAKGERFNESEYDDVKEPLLQDGLIAVRQGLKWGFADKEGNLVISCSYDDAYSFAEDFAAVKLNDLWGYLDEDGRLVVEPQFDAAYSPNEKGIAPIKATDGSWKLIKFDIYD